MDHLKLSFSPQNDSQGGCLSAKHVLSDKLLAVKMLSVPLYCVCVAPSGLVVKDMAVVV
jgi:hypothetical protein